MDRLCPLIDTSVRWADDEGVGGGMLKVGRVSGLRQPSKTLYGLDVGSVKITG